jgi:hypothetical protein
MKEINQVPTGSATGRHKQHNTVTSLAANQ